MDIKKLITDEEMAALMRISWSHDPYSVGGRLKSTSGVESIRKPIDKLLALPSSLGTKVIRSDMGVLPNWIQKAMSVTNRLLRSRP